MDWHAMTARFMEWLGSGSFYRVTLTMGLLLAAVLLRVGLNRFVRREERTGRLEHGSAMLAEKLISLCAFLVLVIGAAVIWSFGLANAWAAVTSVIGLVAIGFFAVWSILSNLVAGLVILVMRPFRIDDHIELLPDGIGGRVFYVNLMFVILKEEDGSDIAVPNNIIFQRIIRRRAARSS